MDLIDLGSWEVPPITKAFQTAEQSRFLGRIRFNAEA
jgi:hypothetical protein